MNATIKNIEVKAQCPVCNRWLHYDDVTGKVNGHGWISMNTLDSSVCEGSDRKARSTKRAYYDKETRKWVLVRWHRETQEWRAV